jgi:hypothetical protein
MSDLSTYCVTHHVDEPDLPGDYRACGECRHVFRTPEELIAAEIENFGDHYRKIIDGEVKPPMYVCPHCTHDF